MAVFLPVFSVLPLAHTAALLANKLLPEADYWFLLFGIPTCLLPSPYITLFYITNILPSFPEMLDQDEIL